MHSNGTLSLDAPLDARCGYVLRVILVLIHDVFFKIRENLEC